MLPAARVASDCLQMAARIRTDPHVGPRRWNHQRADALHDLLVANRPAIGADVSERSGPARPADPRPRVARVAEAGFARGLLGGRPPRGWARTATCATISMLPPRISSDDVPRLRLDTRLPVASPNSCGTAAPEAHRHTALPVPPVQLEEVARRGNPRGQLGCASRRPADRPDTGACDANGSGFARQRIVAARSKTRTVTSSRGPNSRRTSSPPSVEALHRSCRCLREPCSPADTRRRRSRPLS